MQQTDDDSKWIAHELHDRLLPWLHAARMQLECLQVEPQSIDQLELARRCLSQATDEGRAIIGYLEGLNCSERDPLNSGLSSFIESMRPLAEQHGQTLTCEVAPASSLGLDARQGWLILRMIQQAVHNAVQHAGPAALHVQIDRSASGLVVQVRDDGRGFDPTAPVAAGHFGLSGLRQRALAVGGQLHILSQPGAGTTVRLEVPLAPAQPGTAAVQ